MSVEKLKELRQILGLSQMELARKVGVSLLTIQMWERGVGNPNPKNQEKLEKVLKEIETTRREQLEEMRKELQ